MQRRSILAAALAAFLPVRAPAADDDVVFRVDGPTLVDGDAWGFRFTQDSKDAVWWAAPDDLYSRAELEARGEWPPSRVSDPAFRAAQGERNRRFRAALFEEE